MSDMIEYFLPIRPAAGERRSVRARLDLPDDLTQAEAQRLSNFVRSLVIDPKPGSDDD